MLEYLVQAERLRKLGRQPAPKVTNGLAVEPRTTAVQAEFNKPPSIVNAVVQKHYGFASESGALSPEDMPGSPHELPLPGGISPEAYRQLVKQRAVAAAVVQRAQQAQRSQQAQVTRDRRDVAKDYSFRVAVGNAKVLLSTTSPPHAPGGKGAAGKQAVAQKAGPADRPLQQLQPQQQPAFTAVAGLRLDDTRYPKQLTVPDQLEIKRRPEVQAVIAGPTPPPQPQPEAESGPAPAPTACEEGPPGPLLHDLGAAAAAAAARARARLLAHATPAEGSAGAVDVRQPGAGAHGAVSPVADRKAATLQHAYPPPMQRPPVQNRVLSSIGNTMAAPGGRQQQAVGKPYKGRALPLAVSVADTVGLQRIAAKVEDLGTQLPCLCLCGTANVFDPEYTSKCARNCPLYQQPRRYEQLLTFILQNAGVI